MKKSISNTSRFFVTAACLIATSLPCEPVHAQDYVGANAVLRKVEEQTSKPEKKDLGTDENARLQADISEFKTASTNLAPAEAASRWLALVDRMAKLQETPASGPGAPTRVDSASVLGVLPGPVTWPDLATNIAARPVPKGDGESRDIGLRLLAASLTGDAGWRKREIAALQTAAEKADPDKVYFYKSLMEELSRFLVATSDDPDMVIQSLERELIPTMEGQRQQVQIPNLVSPVGAEKAEAFLRKALVSSATLKFDQPNDTSRLAQKLAIELVAQLRVPQWYLVNSLDAVELYEALDKKFATPTNAPASLPGLPGMSMSPEMMEAVSSYNGNGKNEADTWYFLGLISGNRASDAVAAAKKLGRANQSYLPDEAFKAMDRAGYTVALDNFFYELLSQDPGLPFWDEYVQLAAKAGKTDRMVTLARTAATQEDLSKGKKAVIQNTLFKALLAADNVDEGVQEMRRLISLGDVPQQGSGLNPGQLGVILAQIGLLLEKPEWTQEGVAAAEKWLKESSGKTQNSWWESSVAVSLAEILWKLKRGPEAEAVLTDALATAVKNGNGESQFSWNEGGPAQQYLVALATLYHRAGRPEDVLALLDRAPQWGVKDVADLEGSDAFEHGVALMWLHAPGVSLPMSVIAADALLAGGGKEEARKLCNAVLNQSPGSDRGYELLLSLDGTNALPKLDELFSRDQFEERPLIWKAVLLRQEGKLTEAEKTARQAIAIDPSDGEEGPGDRMRAYAVLADIRADQGFTNEAGFFRGAVTAIRLSENADQFYLAGLLKRAIGMYEDSLKHFADAYCIQSRLAIQMASLGMNAEAEEHYRRAYQLMPDSFGRVESHCFGCERAFEGERAQGIAEQVFTKLAAERPDKPQVHYLLGYLREEQEHYDQARQSYLEAVRLDPDYLNAWVKIQALSEHVPSPPKQRDEVAFNILRLDPLQRHAQPDYDQVSDLARLWNAMNTAASLAPPSATNLLTLTASKTAMEKKEADSSHQAAQYQIMRGGMESERHANNTPGSAVAQTPFIKLAAQLLSADSGNSYQYNSW